MCFKNSESFLFFDDSKFVKDSRDIQLCELFCFVYLIESLINQ